jgi:hypothetical protein
MKSGEWIPIMLVLGGFAMALVGGWTTAVTFHPLGFPTFISGLIILIIGAGWGALVYDWDISGGP